MRVGVAAIARSTFDVGYAQEVADQALAALVETGTEIVGDARLLMDEDSVRESVAGLDVDALVVLQASFADSTLVMAAVSATDARLKLWAFPEARSGGRLRLNSLCGINLAAFALTEQGRPYDWVHGSPAADVARRLLDGTTGEQLPTVPPPAITDQQRARARQASERLRSARIGVIGDHPDGFEPCRYDSEALAQIGPSVDRVELSDLFAASEAAVDADVAAMRERAIEGLGPLGDLEQESLEQSLRIGCGLQTLARERAWSAAATRCWPECFTEFGGAVCSPHALLAEQGIPGLCEADAYGGVTALILQWLTDGPAFVADLIDVDGDTGVFWHCGNAPMAMAGSAPGPTIHSNRRKPLLGEFVLAPGVMTVLRVSQSGGRQRLVIGRVEALDAPLPFSGTSAVVRFERPILPTVMGEGLEHHYGLAYGDVTAELWALADELGLEVVSL